MCPKLIVPLQIDLARGFEGTCPADLLTQACLGEDRRDQEPASAGTHGQRAAAYETH
jgi:hypothetical protein